MTKSPFDLTHQNQHTESKIIAALERLSQTFRVLLWNESKSYGLTPIQVQVLIFLLHHEADRRKVSYLAGEFNMTKATISDTIKTLEQKELIKKVPVLSDSRSYTINLTEKGINIAKKSALFTEEIQAPIEKLHSEDKENLLLSLLDIIDHLNKSGIITLQRMCYSCRFYRHDQNSSEHFCELLNKKLENNELRIDCPEHQR